MSQAQELEQQPFGVTLWIKIKAVAKAMGQMWEGYLQAPTAC